MSSNNSYISALRIRVIEWNVLLHGQVQHIFLFIRRGLRILSDVLAGNHMLDDTKRTGRHDGQLCLVGVERGIIAMLTDPQRL